MKKVAYIASECVPFIKTGGLADVVGTLPRIFDKKEYDVRHHSELYVSAGKIQGEDALSDAFPYGYWLEAAVCRGYVSGI